MEFQGDLFFKRKIFLFDEDLKELSAQTGKFFTAGIVGNGDKINI